MQAIIFSLLMPVLPLLIWRIYNPKKSLDVKKAAVRYVLYSLIMTFLSTLVMVALCDEGTSFLIKADASAFFTLKYFLVELAAAVLVAALEWYVFTGTVQIRVETEQYREMRSVRFIRKVLLPGSLYVLAAVVVFMSARLIFDDALWGDEAYSANLVRNNVGNIISIVRAQDPHPPLYYLWLKLLVYLLGSEGWVLHLASLIPFAAGILAAVTLFRKRFGRIPAAFFIVISGMSAPCLEYNLEVRMYALSFFGIAMAFYCSYRVLAGGRIAWIGMVLWALLAAYSHYYGLVIGGILLFVTGVSAILKFRGRTIVKSILVLVFYVVGYLPWLRELLFQTSEVKGNWWNDQIMSLGEALDMAGAGGSFKGILLPLILLFTAILILAESGFVQTAREEGRLLIKIVRPSRKEWSAETYASVGGICTVLGTLALAYLLCVLINPVLARRYLYMLIAVTALTLTASSSGVLKCLNRLGEKNPQFKRLYGCGKLALLLLLCVFLSGGVRDYEVHSSTVTAEKVATEELLALIGQPDQDVKLVVNGVKHLGWTVLYHYFPDNEIQGGTFEEIDADKYWYFNDKLLTEEQLGELSSRGYSLAGYGERQLAKYPLVLYYFERNSAAEP